MRIRWIIFVAPILALAILLYRGREPGSQSVRALPQPTVGYDWRDINVDPPPIPPAIVRAYFVGDLLDSANAEFPAGQPSPKFSPNLFPPRPETSDGLAEVLQVIDVNLWTNPGYPGDPISQWGNWIVVLSTPPAQDALADFFIRLRQAQSSRPPTAAQLQLSQYSPDEHVERQILPDPIDFDAQPLDQAIDRLAGMAHLHSKIEWNYLESAGVARTTPITLHLNHVPFGKAVSMALDQVGGSNASLGYRIDKGILWIEAADDLNKKTVVMIYDVRDLESPSATWNQYPTEDSPFEVESLIVSMFGDRAESIIQLIEETTDTPSWYEQGSGRGSISDWAGFLIVNQTPPVHARIAHLLTMLKLMNQPPPRAADGSIIRPSSKGMLPLEPPLTVQIPAIDFDGLPLRQAVDKLAPLFAVNVDIRWRELEPSGLDLNFPIRLHLKNATPQAALAEINRQWSHADYPMYSYFKDNVLTITTRDDFAAAFVMQCYDIRDLLEDEERIVRSPTSQSSDAAAAMIQAEDRLIKQIEETVDSDSWRDNGGQFGYVRGDSGYLLILQTPENHQKIADLLAKKRADLHLPDSSKRKAGP